MKKKRMMIFIIMIISVLLAGCNNAQSKSGDGADIITDFLSGDYEYTITYYLAEPGGEEEAMYTFDGQLTASPYQRYEKLAESYLELPGVEEVYYYEKDGAVYSDTKRYIFIEGEDKETEWLVDVPAEKSPHFYDADNLTFAYDREEKLDGTETSVFTAECQTVNVSSDGNQRLEIPCAIQLEYYVDMENETLVQVVGDLEDLCKAGAVGARMLEGETESEARTAVENAKDYDTQRFVIEFNLIREVPAS